MLNYQRGPVIKHGWGLSELLYFAKIIELLLVIPLQSRAARQQPQYDGYHAI